MYSDRIFFIGPTGAGKTTIGRRVAEHFGYDFRDLDQEIERQTGAEVSLIFEIEGEAGFRRREAAMLDALTDRPRLVLATGAGAVLDPDNRRRLRQRGTVVYLSTPVERQIHRLRRDKRRPLLQRPDREAVLRRMAQERNPIYEALADVVVPSEAASVDRMAEIVIRNLEADCCHVRD